MNGSSTCASSKLMSFAARNSGHLRQRHHFALETPYTCFAFRTQGRSMKINGSLTGHRLRSSLPMTTGSCWNMEGHRYWMRSLATSKGSLDIEMAMVGMLHLDHFTSSHHRCDTPMTNNLRPFEACCIANCCCLLFGCLGSCDIHR